MNTKHAWNFMQITSKNWKKNRAHYEKEIEICEEEITRNDLVIGKNIQTSFDVNRLIEQNKANHDELASGLEFLIKANLMEIEKSNIIFEVKLC